MLIPEYFRLSQSPDFIWLVLARFTAAALLLGILACMQWKPENLDEFGFFAQFIVPPAILIFDFIKGGEAILFGNILLTILVLYIFVPNRLIYSAAAGILATVATTFVLTIFHDYPASTLISMFIMMLVSNMFGYFAMRQFNVVRRNEYGSYMTERQVQEKLRSEIEKRIATEDGLRLALAETDKASRQKSGALNDLSHELRTPLNAIIGFSDSMQKEVFGTLKNERYLEYSSIIYDSGNHLLELITKMLDHSKAESGTLELVETPLNVEKLVNGVLPMVGSLAREAGVTVSATSQSPVPVILVDEQKIRQILLNLMSNAIKFTPGGGKVELIVDVLPDQTVKLSVKDDGVGIPAGDFEKVFAPFEQSTAQGLRGESGTGLGLPLSKRLAELHGGHIEVVSKVNEGSTFTLVIPKERNLSALDAENEL